METAWRAGRIIGVLIIIQMRWGWNGELHPGGAAFFGFAAGVSRECRFPLAPVGSGPRFSGLLRKHRGSALLISAFPIFGRRTQTMALWFIVLAVVILGVAVVENAAVMSMVSLSEAYTKASAAEREQISDYQNRRGLRAKLGALHGTDLRRWRNLRVLRHALPIRIGSACTGRLRSDRGDADGHGSCDAALWT